MLTSATTAATSRRNLVGVIVRARGGRGISHPKTKSLSLSSPQLTHRTVYTKGPILATTTTTTATATSSNASHRLATALAAMVIMTAATTGSYNHTTLLSAALPSSGDVVSMGSPTKESATGILFPALCNGYQLVGTGVRIKYVFVKVYAVGTYMDPIAMMAVKKGSVAERTKALLDPTYPRTIRIVMNRGLSIDKYTAAIVESLEPRMKGQDLEKYDEKKSSPPFPVC